MGRNRCRWFPCFRPFFEDSKYNEGLQMLPKPKEADESDGLPFIDSDKANDVLIVRKIDPCIQVNGALHHTSKYERMMRDFEPSLIVRRGQTFRIDLHLNRPYNYDTDGISFIFTVEDEEKTSYGQGTLVAIPLLNKRNDSLTWNAIIEETNDNILTVLITPASDCIVAKWRMDCDTRIISDGAYSYSWATPIYILFNPWSNSDQVFMESELWRNECILEDVGIIWRGTASNPRACIWKYEQFEKNVLDCSLYLIRNVGKVYGEARSDPVQIARALAAAVNAVDDDGAVMGNWSNDFSNGTPPTSWIGSAEILQKYYKNKKPVKYAQCWVFSGVLTTICRAIGLPARTISNYSSAHDTHGSLTVDYFMNKFGIVMEELNSDSIWNFHVWNEVWMERPDLGVMYDGWQAIDATPQEQSNEIYRCGPASVNAVKHGDIKKPYDVRFLFAEVNADKVLFFWRYEGPTQPLKLLSKDIHGIGKLICTKDPNSFEMLNITSTYKHDEKTDEERTTMLKALKQSENIFSRYYLNEEFNEIQFAFNLHEDIVVGAPFNVSLMVKNKNSINDYTVNVILRVDIINYHGKMGDPIKSNNFNIKVNANSTTELKMNVTYNEYHKKLIDQDLMKISCLANVEDTNFEYYAEDDFRIRKPEVEIELKDSPIEDVKCDAIAYIVNPLPVHLKRGQFKINAPGLSKTIRVHQLIAPREKIVVKFSFTPKIFGRQTIAAKFTSKELWDCDGYLTVWVNYKKEP